VADLIASARETGASPLTARGTDALCRGERHRDRRDRPSALSLPRTTVHNYLSNAIAKVGTSHLDAIRIARDPGWVGRQDLLAV
jgi:two-component system, NarL family, response regulator DesR